MKKLVLLCVLSLLVTDTLARGGGRGGSRGGHGGNGGWSHTGSYDSSESSSYSSKPTVINNCDGVYQDFPCKNQPQNPTPLQDAPAFENKKSIEEKQVEKKKITIDDYYTVLDSNDINGIQKIVEFMHNKQMHL